MVHLIQADSQDPVIGRTESSRFAPYVQPRFVPPTQEAAVSVRMRSTDSDQLLRGLVDEINQSSLSVTVEVVAEKFMEITADRDDLQLRLNDQKELKENLERKVSTQKVIVKKETTSVKQLEKTVCSLQNENISLQKTSEWLMKRYGK